VLPQRKISVKHSDNQEEDREGRRDFGVFSIGRAVSQLSREDQKMKRETTEWGGFPLIRMLDDEFKNAGKKESGATQ